MKKDLIKEVIILDSHCQTNLVETIKALAHDRGIELNVCQAQEYDPFYEAIYFVNAMSYAHALPELKRAAFTRVFLLNPSSVLEKDLQKYCDGFSAAAISKGTFSKYFS